MLTQLWRRAVEEAKATRVDATLVAQLVAKLDKQEAIEAARLLAERRKLAVDELQRWEPMPPLEVDVAALGSALSLAEEILTAEQLQPARAKLKEAELAQVPNFLRLPQTSSGFSNLCTPLARAGSAA